MKIRDKITLIFSLLTGSLLLFFFIFIYYLSYRYTETEFYLRLKERVNIAAQAYLEEDELSANIFKEIRNKHLQIIPGEKEAIFQVDLSEKMVLNDVAGQFPKAFFDQIFDRQYGQLKTGSVYHAGILYTDNEGDFIVTVSARDQYGKAEMRHLLNILIVSFLTGLILIYLVGIFYAGRVLSPIAAIAAKANEISANNLHLRLETTNTRDELNELATTFNHMLDRLETAFESQHNFINNASHELRNPLTAILGEIEVTLNKQRSVEDYRASLQTIQEEAQRLDLLIKSLLELAQTGLEDKRLIIEPLRVDELLIQVKQNLDSTHPENQVLLDFTGLPEQSDLLVIPGNQSLLMVALGNILENACKFSDNQEVIVKIGGLKGQINISVTDQGVGIPGEDLRNITEPFYRAANARGFKGFGIGLSLAGKIFNFHHGKMVVTSKIMEGTKVTISFQTNRKRLDQELDPLLF